MNQNVFMHTLPFIDDTLFCVGFVVHSTCRYYRHVFSRFFLLCVLLHCSCCTNQVKPMIGVQTLWKIKKQLRLIGSALEGLIQCEIRARNQTINQHLYTAQSSQSTRLFSTRLHKAQFTKTAILELDWEILTHLPYSSDLAPSGFYLFSRLSNQVHDIR